MKKLLGLLCAVGFIASATAEPTPPPMPMMQNMDPVCQQAMQHIHASHTQIESAIKANDANKVGTLVIANHNYMESFIKQHPECKPKRPPMPPAAQ
ncbi:MAG: hypothetical protein EKK57_00435 [Proteobacteria bacterium]|nr:MAG: hypothetical protein EKK57_00435 [Pseudomonadota bacterium]